MTPDDLLRVIVREMVVHPDMVDVERKEDERGVLLILSVAPDDMAMVIGKKGDTAKGLRSIMRVVGKKSKSTVSVKIKEPAHDTQSDT
jgi:predicted RNA-binding protein YlqC (UPF0109 family)